MMANIWWSLPLALVIFFAVRKLATRCKFPLFSPLLVAMVVIIPFLMLTDISYDSYLKDSRVLNDLLQLAVTVLAYPLYEQLHQIHARWKSITTICFTGSMITMVTGASVVLLMDASPEVAVSILSRSVTTPIAVAADGSIGGTPVISAVCMVLAGILSATFGHILLNATRTHTKAMRGLIMGITSRTLGMVRCAELDYQEDAFSPLALVLYGIITSLIAPFLFPIILAVVGQSLRYVAHFRCKFHALHN